ncbi:hypothetical protein ACS0TY_016295 [Phlomoides rotata]
MEPDDSQNPPSPPAFPAPPSFPQFSPYMSYESKPGGGGSLPAAPHPLESLYETPIPPFLSKTYDLVDDPSLDSIISWSGKGDSFVVKDHVEFSRTVLPRNFKHNNFSSFVRQLNTYGFRKIDADKWEFANEGFIRGQMHLLKTIQRRRSHHSHQFGSSSEEAGKAALEGEIERLREERSLMMQEVIELQNQQRGTIQHMEVVNEKLQTAEERQKQMVSFLGNFFQNPAFLARLQQKREQKSITSPRTNRKFVKHQADELVDPFIPLQEIGNNPGFGTTNMPFQDGDASDQNSAMGHEFLEAPEPTEGVLIKGKGVVGPPPPQTSPEYFISFPDDVATGKNIPELSVSESMGMEDGIWSMGFEPGSGMLNSNELWGNVSNYDEPKLGGLSDVWNIQGAESSGIERWPDEDAPFNELEKHESLHRDDVSKK